MTEIRWARLEDARNLGFVHSKSYRNTYQGIIPDEFLNQYTPVARERYFYNALIQGAERIAIMLVDNKAVGCLIINACSDKNLQTCSGEISAIYLDPNFKAIGLGKQLLSWGLEKLKDLGYATAILWVLKENKNAFSFYEKQGFWNDGVERKIFRGIELSQIRFQKALI